MNSVRRRFERERAALLAVDIQLDFMPGGALAVPDGDAIVAPVAALFQAGIFDVIIATQDWHPRKHVSFASSHPGRIAFERITLYGQEQTLWPDHCVQGTAGAELHRGIPWECATAIIRKALDPAVDSYSAFRNNWDPGGRRPPTGLAGLLHERGIDDLYICGLARDFCVKWTAQDGLREGFHVTLLWDLCRAIDASADDRLRQELVTAGVRVVTLQDLYAEVAASSA